MTDRSTMGSPRIGLPKIGLNAQLLSLSDSYRSAGVHRYILQMLQALPRLDREHNYLAFTGEARLQENLVDGLDVRLAPFSTANPLTRILWEQFVQPFALRREGLSLIHGLVNVLPLVLPCPGAVTIHDLSFLRYPQAFKALKRLYLRLMTRRSAQQADMVIAVSESTRQDVIRLLGISPAKVRTVLNGVESSYHPLEAASLEDFRRRVGLADPFILYVGTLEPRKNIPVLLQAFHQLKQRGNVPHKLVLIGARGWLYQPIFATLESLALQNQVLFPGFVPPNELVAWYNAAEIFVYPSLYEGFGLPVLEAMACGTPVVCSDRSSLPEVAGDAALQVDPTRPEALAEALGSLIRNAALRHHLAAKGLARAQYLTWDRSAQETVRAYAQTLPPLPEEQLLHA
ncbi:MAG: glycosyltransferase family 4 protein [Chloroflexi bacterium]|nr:glycosyltransferase family 4 protein [Chloroflexota bacterium]